MNYIFVTSILLCIILLVLMPLYLYLKNINYAKSLTLLVKGSTTGLILITAIFGMLLLSNSHPPNFAPKELIDNWWIVLGLFLCMLADIILEINFLIGGVFFFLGHFSYILFFLKLAQAEIISIPIFVVLIALALCYFYCYFVISDIKKCLYALYVILLSASFSLGIVLPFTFGMYGLFPALAITLLIISDFLLARNRLNTSSMLSETVALSFYFMGQFFMAMSIYMPAVLLRL